MPYESIDEAVEIANATRHALGASVFGPDKYECLDVAKRLECGMVAINDFGVFYVSITYSTELSKVLIQLCTQLKYVRSTSIVLHILTISPTQSRFTVRRDKIQWLWEIWSVQFL